MTDKETRLDPPRQPMALTRRETQLILALRSTKKPTVYMVVVGGDGELKVASELGQLLDLNG